MRRLDGTKTLLYNEPHQVKPRGNSQVETCKKLPASHKGNQIACIELERSPVLSRLIRVISAALALLFFLVGYLLFPLEALLEMDDVFVHLVTLMLGMMSVFLIHELLRGLLMRIFSGVKPIIRYVGSYPHAACEAYFGRTAQQIINIVPPGVLVLMLLVLLLTTADMSWKWMVWLILTVGICSCVGDVYVALRMMRLPQDILVQNIGPTYLIYSASAPGEPEEN